MVPYINLSKIRSYCFWVQDNSELGIVTSKQFHVSKIPTNHFWPVHKTITRISPEFSELSLWLDTQSFDIWSIPPRLEVLPLTQKYQT